MITGNVIASVFKKDPAGILPLIDPENFSAVGVLPIGYSIEHRIVAGATAPKLFSVVAPAE
jgi:hypothetical protein